VLLVLGLGACEGDLLDVYPVDEIDGEIAIVDAATAQAALAGAYQALFGYVAQDQNYYSGDYVVFGDLLSDNAEHTGTFDTYSQAGRNSLLAESITLDRIWSAIYDGINRVNILIEEVPALAGVDPAEEDQILAEAHALRALHYFNLVRAWGGVPLVLVSERDPNAAAQVSRASVAEVYAQILNDLNEAESRFGSAGSDNGNRTFATPGFVDALQAKVHLYQGNWSLAQSHALDVVNSGEYDLAEVFSTLFPADEGATSEEVFSVAFTEDAFNIFGFYYQFAGRFEVGATESIYFAYPAGDERWAWNFGEAFVGAIEVTKFPTTIGAENVHVIRYAEVLLILAEALARQGGPGNLATAVEYLNMVRTRADVDAYHLATDLNNSQQRVLEAVWLERRLELAFEGDRWFDLVRTGRAVNVIPTLSDPNFTLWPLPQGELDVAPNLTQNPGY
jgi:hypothetical protein